MSSCRNGAMYFKILGRTNLKVSCYTVSVTGIINQRNAVIVGASYKDKTTGVFRKKMSYRQRPYNGDLILVRCSRLSLST